MEARTYLLPQRQLQGELIRVGTGAWKWELNKSTPKCFLVNSGFTRTTKQARN